MWTRLVRHGSKEIGQRWGTTLDRKILSTSVCDRTCGPANKTRAVECKSDEETLDASECDAEKKPNEFESCNLGPCEGVEWIVSDWSSCDDSCSSPIQSREAHCANEDGVVFPDDACDATKMPELTQPCSKSTMCEAMWHTTEWSECSVKCGVGVQSRVVFCGTWENESVIKIDDDKCDIEKSTTISATAARSLVQASGSLDLGTDAPCLVGVVIEQGKFCASMKMTL
ncbi:papilin [Caerostris extrusa]|uniref:Papilin n=1 Tax=Caerostris extrusa TaxID=172846 RepID=A0AAV4VC71_CAEEX|nr:papilin [Caerostris extrusa]